MNNMKHYYINLELLTKIDYGKISYYPEIQMSNDFHKPIDIKVSRLVVRVK